MLEFLDAHSGNNDNIVGIWSISVGRATLGQVTTHLMMPKDLAAPLPMNYLIVLYIKFFDRLIYQKLSNGKAFEGWMLVRCCYIKSTSANQTVWLQRGLAGAN